LRVVVFGHAVLEKALEPFPGITCKVLFADPGGNLDAQAAACLSSGIASPALLAPLPVFGLPGWHPENHDAAFYADASVFRAPRE
jgi:hypothetical protein